MPITGTKGANDKAASSNTAGNRSTFRPPWVKEGPKPIPMPTESAPWTKRNSTAAAPPKPAAANGVQKEVKLQSKEIKVPVVTTRKTSIPEPVIPKPKPVKVIAPEDNYETSSSEYEEVTDSEEEGSEEEVTETESEDEAVVAQDEPKFQVKLKPVEKPPPPKVEKSPSTDKAGKFVRPVLKKVPKIDEVPKEKPPPPTIPEKKVLRTVAKPDGFKEPPLIEQKDFVRPPTVETKTFVRPPLKKVDSTKKMPPPPPPAPPAPPAPPPPPGGPGKKGDSKEIERINDKQKQMLDKLKSRPRRRPDWSDMMKEVESGKKLRHVETNDRSKPILKSETITNIQGQFVYETEKENVRNAFLKEIQFGIKLKSVKTNDRSKPVLEGLRKFRRQMTIEEQIQKSESRAQLGTLANNEEVPPEESGDEMDDIDKLRDDLQSTKQMLALELRNKEAQERENKRLLAKIQQLEAELSAPKKEGDTAKPSGGGDNDALVKSLKAEAAEAQQTSKLLEKKYQDAAEQLDTVKSEVEEQKRTISNLEKKLAQATGTSSSAQSRRQSEAVPRDSSPEPELEPSEGEEDEDEEKKAERLARRLVKEVKFLCSKLIRLKDKQKAARKERQNIRDAMKKNQLTLKDEKKKFKALQREVDKMAALMKEDDDDSDKSDDDEAEADADAEAEEEEAEAEESESEESESEAEADSDSESEAEDAPNEKKKANYEPRVKRQEGRLAALKKGNLLRQANLDRLIDEINRIRDEQVTLQRDLDSVLSELG